jgi:hypothetical protein
MLRGPILAFNAPNPVLMLQDRYRSTGANANLPAEFPFA